LLLAATLLGRSFNTLNVTLNQQQESAMNKSRFSLVFIISVIGLAAIIPTINIVDCEPRIVKANRLAEQDNLEIKLNTSHSTLSWDSRDPGREKYQLPVLYLHRERDITLPSARTIEIQLIGISGPKELALEIISRHVDVSTGKPHTATKPVMLPDGDCDVEHPCVVRWTIDSETTPSDFYTLRVYDKDGQVLWQNPCKDRPDIVMLDTWDLNLDDYTARIIYATLFPFAKGQNDFENRLAPCAVMDFIEQQFVSIISQTWITQFHVWGLGNPMHPAWDGDNIYEIIITDAPFALFGDIGLRSHFIDKNNHPTKECRLWWASSSNSFQAYDTLENAYKAVYSHEFFHLVQRNLLLFTEHPDHRWMYLFIEGQGKFAPSVQYPDMEIRRYNVRSQHQSEYLSAANRMLSQSLNSTYCELEADRTYRYDYALYWRFLYERYGDMVFVKIALESMTESYQEDPVAAVAMAMNQTFQQSEGAFGSFEESLVAFARANYALRLHNGRCKELDFSKCGGLYYDPSNTYVEPPLAAELAYNETPLIYEGAIPASYGMDFLEITLEKRSFDQPVTISIEGGSDVTRFSVQLWKVIRASPKQRAITPYPESVPVNCDGIHKIVLPNQDDLDFDRLALIITRLDAHEHEDPNGNYILRVMPVSK
jgi:hypothetical protein